MTLALEQSCPESIVHVRTERVKALSNRGQQNFIFSFKWQQLQSFEEEKQEDETSECAMVKRLRDEERNALLGGTQLICKKIGVRLENTGKVDEFTVIRLHCSFTTR